MQMGVFKVEMAATAPASVRRVVATPTLDKLQREVEATTRHKLRSSRSRGGSAARRTHNKHVNAPPLTPLSQVPEHASVHAPPATASSRGLHQHNPQHLPRLGTSSSLQSLASSWKPPPTGATTATGRSMATVSSHAPAIHTCAMLTHCHFTVLVYPSPSTIQVQLRRHHHDAL